LTSIKITGLKKKNSVENTGIEEEKNLVKRADLATNPFTY